MALKVEIIDEKEAPAPPKAMTARAKESLAVINQLKPGKVARITPGDGQSTRGLKAGLTRVAKSNGKKVVTWDQDGVVYVKLA